MKIKEVVDALEMFAPLPLQDGFDIAVLQIGLTVAEAAGGFVVSGRNRSIGGRSHFAGLQPDCITPSSYF